MIVFELFFFSFFCQIALSCVATSGTCGSPEVSSACCLYVCHDCWVSQD